MLLKTFTREMILRYLQNQNKLEIQRLKKVKLMVSTITMQWITYLVRKVLMEKVV